MGTLSWARPRRGSPGRGAVLGLGLAADLTALPQPAALRRGEALLQRVHEIDHLAARPLGGLLGDDLLALGLSLQKREDLLAIVVPVLSGVEVCGERIDQLLRHLQLAFARLRVRVRKAFQLVLGDDLVLIQHRRDRQCLLQRPHRREILLGPQHEAGDADAVRAFHRLDQQRVRLRRAAIGHQVVRVLVVDRIDLGQIDEVLDLDRLVGAWVESFQLLARHRDVSAFADLEALDDVLPGDFLAVDAADALLLDAPAVLVVQHVEAHFLGGSGGEQFHRHADQSEADGPAPDRPRHRYATSFAAAPAADGGKPDIGAVARAKADGSTPKYPNNRSWCCRRPRNWMRLREVSRVAAITPTEQSRKSVACEKSTTTWENGSFCRRPDSSQAPAPSNLPDTL